jgi:hypothetical protein
MEDKPAAVAAFTADVETRLPISILPFSINLILGGIYIIHLHLL